MKKPYSRMLTGSSNLEASEAGKEIIPCPLWDFSLYVDDECHVKINHGEYVYLRAKQSVKMDGCVIDSCVIKESNISFNWAGLRSGTVEVED